jgi:hypothetical protein
MMGQTPSPATLVEVEHCARFPWQACILLDARLGHKEGEQPNSQQKTSRNHPGAAPSLRAVHVTVNQAARGAVICMYPNWRHINLSSQVFERQEYGEAVENLDWWTTSDEPEVQKDIRSIPCALRNTGPLHEI